jgi:hypothetical protein
MEWRTVDRLLAAAAAQRPPCAASRRRSRPARRGPGRSTAALRTLFQLLALASHVPAAAERCSDAPCQLAPATRSAVALATRRSDAAQQALPQAADRSIRRRTEAASAAAQSWHRQRIATDRTHHAEHQKRRWSHMVRCDQSADHHTDAVTEPLHSQVPDARSATTKSGWTQWSAQRAQRVHPPPAAPLRHAPPLQRKSLRLVLVAQNTAALPQASRRAGKRFRAARSPHSAPSGRAAASSQSVPE